MLEKFPLLDKKIIVTRAEGQQGEARHLIEKYGGMVLDMPALVIQPPIDWNPLDDALLALGSFHWIIFSSSNGVHFVEERMKLISKSLVDLPKGLKIAAVGQKTARNLENMGIVIDFIPPDFVADSLIDNFPVSAMGLKVLIPRVQTGGRKLLGEAFGQAGAHVVEVAAYESVCPTEIPDKTALALKNLEVSAILFTSSKTVVNTCKLLKDYFGSNWRQMLDLVKILSIGPQTTCSCQKYFGRVDKQAKKFDLEGLVQACIDSF